MFRFVQGETEVLGKKVPDYFFAVMPWLIAARRINVWAEQAENQGPWFTHQYDRDWGLRGELPLVQMLKDLPRHVRADGPVPAQWAKPPWETEPGVEWDNRLKYLGVMRESVGGVEGPYWKLIKAQWYDHDEVGGAAGYIFVTALDENGTPIEAAGFVVERSGASDPVVTKGPIDGYWGDYGMHGFLGTYRVRMEHGGYPSEAVVGIGLGLEDEPRVWARTAFRLVFRLTNQ